MSAVGWFATVLGFGALVLLTWPMERERRLTRARRLEHRNPATLPSIFQAHYASRGVVWDNFEEVWRAIAKLLYVDPERLLPSDAFGVELRPAPHSLTEDEIVDVYDYLLDLQRKGRLFGDIEQIRTLDDVILALKPGNGGGTGKGAGRP